MAENYVSLAEVGELLAADKESRGLLVVQNAAMEHAQAVSRISAEDTKNLIEELKEVSLVTNFTAVKIADALPKYPQDLRAIFQKERVVLDDAETSQILEIVAKYL